MSRPAASGDRTPQTYLLVHGAWHGGWCWRRVADRLIAHGHRVFAPTLTGVGERAHLLSRSVDLDTHIADIVNLMKWEDLGPVVLCGHSYGGLVISGVAEAMEPAIAAIVFLDAFVPQDGDAMVTLTSAVNRAAIEAAERRGEAGVPAPPAAVFHVNERDRAWVDAKCTPHPLGTMMQPIRLTGARERIAKKAYIRAAAYESPYFSRYLAAARRDPAWRCYEVPCGHDVMVDDPDRLVEILEEVA